MSAIMTLSVWSGILSATLCYAVWVKLRVWMLRQDLFNVRDELWEQMRCDGTLNDPSYQSTRDVINSIIRLAPYLSFVVLARILFEGQPASKPSSPCLSAVVEARRKIVGRLLKYMLQESLVGVAAVVMAKLYHCKSIAEAQVAKWIDRLFDSRSVREMRLRYEDEWSVA